MPYAVHEAAATPKSVKHFTKSILMTQGRPHVPLMLCSTDFTRVVYDSWNSNRVY